MEKFHWQAIENAPLNYPMEILVGYLVYADKGARYVPHQKTIVHDWGRSLATYQVLPETNLKLGPLPVKLDITFFSYEENRFYHGTFDLPYAKIVNLFQTGYYSPSAKDQTSYEQIVVGVAPGGAVSVWLTGTDSTVEVFFGLAEPTDTLWFNLHKESEGSREAIVTRRLDEVTNIQEVRNRLKKYKHPSQIWQDYRLRYDWQPVFIGLELRDSWIQSIDYFNGETGSLQTPMSDGAVDSMRALPKSMSIIVKEESNTESVVDINFDETETRNAFHRLGKTRQYLETRAENSKKSEFTVWLRNNKQQIQLKQVKVGVQAHNTPRFNERVIQRSEQSRLKAMFLKIVSNKAKLEDYFSVSQILADTSPYVRTYAFQFADHVTKLLLHFLGTKNYGQMENVITHYVEKILPNIGQVEKSSDVASLGIVAALLSKNENLANLIFKKILGEHYDVENENNGVLTFNLACYYATHNQKNKMLKATQQTLALRKVQQSFLTDTDFKDYWGDAEFLALVDPNSDFTLMAGTKKENNNQDTQLHLAATAGNAASVETLLIKGFDVNAVGKNNFTPLHLAAKAGHVDVARVLLANGANVQGKEPTNEGTSITPLHLAALYRHFEMAQLLVAKGADVNKRNGSEETPLHRASISGAADIVKLLLDNGAQVNVKDDSDWTPLHEAASRGGSEVAVLLIAHGADVNAKGRYATTPLHRAAEHGDKDTVALLLAKGAQINAQEELHNATPLQEIFKQTINYSTEYERDYLGVVKLLLSKGAETNVNDKVGSTLMHLAASSGRKDLVRYLLSLGIDVNVRNKKGATPLFYAVGAEKTSMVEFLIANGADVNAATDNERTPYAVAEARNNVAMMKILSSQGGKAIKSVNTDLDTAERLFENEDIESAFKLVKPHAEAGHARAQFFYGRLLLLQFMIENYGKSYDREIRSKEQQANSEAISWMTKSAEQHYPAAQEALGMMYSEGDGVPQDPILGHMWLILSAQGDKAKLEDIKASSERNYDMPQELFNQAQRMADEWQQDR